MTDQPLLTFVKNLVLALILIIVVAMLTMCVNIGQTEVLSPKESEMKAIFELATMECYYHNVAKFKEEANSLFFWLKDKHFWVEYSGRVTVGIDASKVLFTTTDNVLEIQIPDAQVLQCTVDENTLTEESFIFAKNSAKIDAGEQSAVLREAQEQMLLVAQQDTILLANAKARAKQLLEEYINSIAQTIDQQYSIRWIDI